MSSQRYEQIEITLSNYKDILKLHQDGVEIYMVAGRSQHGKSQFLYALTRAWHNDFGSGEPTKTKPGSVFGWTFPYSRRKLFVCDIAGDDFQTILSAPKAELFTMLAQVLPCVKGLVLNIALDKHYQAQDSQALPLYRFFLNFALAAQAKVPGLAGLALESDQLALKTVGLPPLAIPVLVNFSMADKYLDVAGRPLVTIPGRRHPEEEENYPERKIDPRKDDPTELACKYMPEIYDFLLNHAQWFKFTFTHAKTDREPDDREGCAQAFEFLVQAPWQPVLGGRIDARWLHRLRFGKFRKARAAG